ncbi:MAG: acetyl-CoA carboxylase biotin carboxylase subunit [Candidatus Auribacterota bacterium]|jgi:acetyl-CoA carboxylase biotin carboxylase subunit|uniref:Biotin carboxylase n=1 Tax=Candidatus Auribacter fodinae TaxID=2093366 RepID=A0A3A4R5K8_9BACT|nr:MAG: acetyl-CoA carboxylase biotin carboxylase subunit [Candidatus Auribacter fodinae]
MFKRILIANRGEIALRIIRACHELNIETVAVYSEADADSLHAKMADSAICIGPASSLKSYLHIPSIISAAEIGNVDAIHPGYGFLAENAHFAEICESCNIKFIGPKPKHITLMGDKSKAKETVKSAGVPTIPGSEGVVKTTDEAIKIAREMGYPVIIKASAGGGGRGMRVANNDISLANAFMSAKAEAEAAFGNADVYIEKFIEQPRHVEIQIIADSFGNTVHLFERDCTVQRRHQKMIEESPCPVLTPQKRKKMGEAAVKAAQSVNYENAGTIEFLYDKNGEFYFMEMNTRIQVEHPVTEMITGIDLIKEQIRVAYGEKLSFTQNDIKMNGHAIECRINAEDPDKNFMPSPGVVTGYYAPGGYGVRVDSHVYAGYRIPQYYDSMIAKLIVHGKTREEAISIMSRALGEFTVEGIKTNISFQKTILNEDGFKSGKISTDYIAELLKSME